MISCEAGDTLLVGAREADMGARYKASLRGISEKEPRLNGLARLALDPLKLPVVRALRGFFIMSSHRGRLERI